MKILFTCVKQRVVLKRSSTVLSVPLQLVFPDLVFIGASVAIGIGIGIGVGVCVGADGGFDAGVGVGAGIGVGDSNSAGVCASAAVRFSIFCQS